MAREVSLDDLFDQRMVLPDVEARERLSRLVGIDDQRDRLTKMLAILVNPTGIEKWAAAHHPGSQNVIDTLLRRPPLVIVAGDVGCGKTELAETVGDAVARQEGIDVTLYPMSLSTRGEGRVGEMTQLLSAAFAAATEAAEKLKASSGKARGAVLLLVDEADAITQSREEAQMHHEDRAGVNAFIRGVDQLARAKLPAATILCTNRLNALDPAVRRRAADILRFDRPDAKQRRAVLTPLLEPVGLNPADIDEIVNATGPQESRQFGHTFSDLLQRLVPAILLDAYPDRAVDAKRAIVTARVLMPTAPFNDGIS